MNKTQKIRKFVRDNKTLLAFSSGSMLTSAVFLWSVKDRTLLELNSENLEMLKQGGAIVYKLKDQTLHLVNIPAVEATLAAL